MKPARALLVLIPLFACSAEDPSAPEDRAVLELGIENAVLVEPHLVSSGQFSAEQLAALSETGYRTVIQLRLADEEGSGWEEAAAAKLGIAFVRIPVAGAEGLTEENARKLDAALSQRGSGGALIACSSGNRVGGLLALKAHFCDQLSADEALALGKMAGLTRAEPEVRKALGLP